MLNGKNKFLTIFSIIVLLFLLLPLLFVVVTSFNNQPTISFPIKGFTFKWYKNIVFQPDFVEGFRMSLIIAFLASFLSLLVGIPAVYAIVKGKIKHSSRLQAFFLSPTLIPEIVIGFAIYQALVIKWRFALFPSLLIGHFLLCLPYVIRLITASMEKLDPHIEEAAWINGASRLKAFFKVVLPNIQSAVISAFMVCFITSFNNIPVSLFLNGPGLNMLPTSILNYLQNNYDPTVSAISVVLMLFTAFLMWAVEHFLGLNQLRVN